MSQMLSVEVASEIKATIEKEWDKFFFAVY